MTTWYEYIQKDAPHLAWPYPIHYGQENAITSDVLVIGGGVAGCHAAINAVKRGAKVVVIDKGPVRRSGCSGAGVDHWHAACTNPCSTVTPEAMLAAYEKDVGIPMANWVTALPVTSPAGKVLLQEHIHNNILPFSLKIRVKT